MQLIENAPLKAHNSFGISASARYFITLESDADIFEVLDDSRWRTLPRLVLGEGSNILFTKDFPGVVLHPGTAQLKVLGTEDGCVFVRVDAGFSWHRLVLETLKRGYAGLENLSLIPGTVGAAPIQNIGAYGVELKSCFHQLSACDLHSGEIQRFDIAAAKFGYRDSYFKQHPGRYLIQSVTFKLPLDPVWQLGYGGLGEALATFSEEEIDAHKISNAVCELRRQKLPDPATIGNAGSFFKNPVIPQQQADQLKAYHPHLPVFQHGDNNSKLSAAWLIDQCGWKGFKQQAAGVSAQHALVLVNHGGASGAQIWRLASDIQASVLARFGVTLEAEPRII